MKLSDEKLIPNQPATIKIIPEKSDDLWLLYNLIVEDDVVSAVTTRKIQFSSDLTAKKKSRKHIDMDVIPNMVIASKDSIKDDFRAYLLLEAQKRKIKSIERNESRILMIHQNNIKDILSDKVIKNMNANTKVIEKFMDMVINKCDWVCYGTKSVEYAHELLAIDTLLITEELSEKKDIKLRKKYSKLKKLVQEAGGKVIQFSDVEGDKLAQMTGIAAILRFPIPNIDDLVL
nr:protein PELOTA 1-like [Solanum lycopersicum]